MEKEKDNSIFGKVEKLLLIILQIKFQIDCLRTLIFTGAFIYLVKKSMKNIFFLSFHCKNKENSRNYDPKYIFL